MVRLVVSSSAIRTLPDINVSFAALFNFISFAAKYHAAKDSFNRMLEFQASRILICLLVYER
jgi:hypothetical protein